MNLAKDWQQSWNDLADALAAYRAVIEAACAHVDGLPSGLESRRFLPMLQFQQALEDAASIELLLSNRRVGSARALIRPQFEALTRGAWLRTVATNADLDRYAAGLGEMPRLADVREALRCNHDAQSFAPLGERVDFETWRRAVKDMNDFTHRGTRAMCRLSQANMAGPYAIADDEPTILSLSFDFAVVAVAALLAMDERSDHSEFVDELKSLKARFVVALKHLLSNP